MDKDQVENSFDAAEWSFDSKVDLDPRLLCSLSDMCFHKPTDVQKRSIPLIYEGKNVYMQCRTGSGKTAAYLVPIIERLLQMEGQGVRAMILVPTRDLSWQITDCVERLTKYCEIKAVDLCKFVECRGDEINKRGFSIVVSTPAKALSYMKRSFLDFKGGLDFIVLDEADLILSYGYENDTREVLSLVSKGYQICLASATLGMGLCKSIGISLKDLAMVQLDSPDSGSKVRHYYVLCDRKDRYLHLCYILKFRMNPFGSGKTLIFVNTIDEAYHLRVLLELFGVRCCSLNPNLPIESRIHVIREFNKGVYDNIIAVDQHARTIGEYKGTDPASTTTQQRIALSYGAARGIDFRRVDSVINFDFPLDSGSYIHRAGRTGRAPYGKGVVLSFFDTRPTFNPMDLDLELKDTPFIDVISACKSRNILLDHFPLNSEDLEPFRYRVENTLRAVTKRAIKYAKVTEIKNEILNSKKLKSLLESDTRLLSSLRHDSSLTSVKVESNISHIPKYLLPKSLATQAFPPNSLSSRAGSLSGARMKSKRKRGKQSLDPLKSFKCM